MGVLEVVVAGVHRVGHPGGILTNWVRKPSTGSSLNYLTRRPAICVSVSHPSTTPDCYQRACQDEIQFSIPPYFVTS